VAMPPQLKIGLERRKKRPRFLPPKPLLESLPSIDARWLARKGMFPDNWGHHGWRYDGIGFTIPAIRSLMVNRAKVVVTHLNGSRQNIPIKWLGAVRVIGRPAFVCGVCKRNSFKLYCRNNNFACYRCSGGRYASQVRHSAARAQLQASRLRNALHGYPVLNQGKPRRPMWMKRYTYDKLINKLRQLDARAARSKSNLITRRVGERATRPLTAYNSIIIGRE
jgi:hypothetical protein